VPVLLGLGAFALAVLLHGFAARVPAKLDSVRRFLLVGMPVGLALVAAAPVAYGPTLRAAAPILLYAFLCEFYIFLFTLTLSSVSATMLIMLRRGPVPPAALASVYKPAEMVQLRVERMQQQGLVRQIDGRLSAADRGRSLHRVFVSLRSFFRHPPP